MRKASRPSGKSVLPKARNALRWLIGQALAICWEIPPMSAIGTKRTSPSALHMSAFDPKRTLRLLGNRPRLCAISHSPSGRKVLRLFSRTHAATQFHHTSRRRGGDVDANCARAATGHAGDRISQQWIA